MYDTLVIHHMRQDSEAWQEVRRGKVTSSRFGDIITPAQLKLSKSASKYAAQLVAERLGIASPDPIPTFWMERGLEAEPKSLAEFQRITGAEVQQVGFVQLSPTMYVGCSPDAIVNAEELLEIKCPKVETLIEWHNQGKLPNDYRMQVQGQLWVTGAECCHFFAWHEALEPLHIRVLPDPTVHAALNQHMGGFLKLVDHMQSKVVAREVTEENRVDPEYGEFNG